MRRSDIVREVCYPLLVFSMIASVWCMGYSSVLSGSSEVPTTYPAIDPVASMRALEDPPADSKADAPTTRPTAISAINPDE
jgi:hypothetical protein